MRIADIYRQRKTRGAVSAVVDNTPPRVLMFIRKEALTIKKLLLVILLAALSLTGCGATQIKRYEASFSGVFDTYSQITVYAASKEQAQTAMQRAYDELKECHRLYDIYNTYEGVNNLKTVNDNAGVTPVAVDGRIIGLLTCAADMYELTGGRMNVALGSVLRLWHDCRTEALADASKARLPDADALKAAATHTDISNVVIDAEAGTVYLADAYMSLDVGALAKGYATERAAQALADSGIDSALLSIGGNVRAIGARGDGTAWRAGVQNPDLTSSEASIATAELIDMSLVSSGSYQRYFTVNGERYHHIIDPDTLYPAAYCAGVSVMTRDSALADALSTALFVMPTDEGMALISGIDGAEALWAFSDGTIVKSDGFK